MLNGGCSYTVAPALPPAFDYRNVRQYLEINWPDAALMSSASYGVDFTNVLGCCGEDRLVAVAAETTGGFISWSTLYGNKAVVWISWSSVGNQQTTVSVKTARGKVLTADVGITVTMPAALFPPQIPSNAPNAAVAWGAFAVDRDNNVLILG